MLASLGAHPAASAGQATVELPLARTTSAGVFDDAGRLVRTLWSGRKSPAGKLLLDWDGKDDEGKPVPTDGRYSARILHHDVRYTWEGVIGNTSVDPAVARRYRALGPINDMAIDTSGNAFYVVGYNEGGNALHRFGVRDPQLTTPLAHADFRRVFRHVATDGSRVYFANVGLLAPKGKFNRVPETFVLAINVKDGIQHRFAAGREVMHQNNPAWSHWNSVVDHDLDDFDQDGSYRSAPAGLAVQKTGNLLFVAHPGQGEIRVLDKLSGINIGRIALDEASDLDTAADDSLWVLAGKGSQARLLHLVQQAGAWVEAARIQAGLMAPVAIAVSPVDGSVVVVDAGSEQLKAFDSKGSPLWTLGQPNGYQTGGPAVAPDRFWFSAGPSYVAFQSDGSFWVGDPGNHRNLRFDSRRRYSDQIMYSPVSYTVSVDPNDPSRVFNRFLEFRVDYARPLAQSWTLVRNWGAGLPEKYRGFGDGIRLVATLRNGRTYAAIARFGPETKELVELTDAGLRPTGITLPFGVRLYPDGSQRTFTTRFGRVTVSERTLSGFDTAGNPEWGSWSVIAQAGATDDLDPHYHKVPAIAAANEATFPETANGIVVVFNPGISRGFHLGGLSRGAREWLWRSSPAGTWKLDAGGQVVDADGSYELERGVQYPGNIVTAAGPDIIYGYHGEAWNQGQANQWIHYQDDGLFVGQFGTANFPGSRRYEAMQGVAGNAFSPSLVRVGGNLHLWHNDEHMHGGVHRWRIEGLDGVRRISVPIIP